MPKPAPLNQVIAENLSRLMAAKGLTQTELARVSGVGQSTLSRILDSNAQADGNPRTSTLETLAAYFKVAPWKLLVPNAPMELLAEQGTQKELDLIVNTYVQASDLGRQTILRIAEAESRYSNVLPFTKTST